MSFGGGGGGSSRISTSSDVALSSPTTGQVLAYDGSAQLWKNQAVPATSSSKGVCIYNQGGGAYPARPAGYASVEFIGPVDPGSSALTNDTWISTT